MFVKNKHLQPNTILYKLKSQIYVIKILNFEGGKIVGCLTYTFSYSQSPGVFSLLSIELVMPS